MTRHIWYIVHITLLCIFAHLYCVVAKVDQVTMCHTCIAVVEEVERQTTLADPKKMIDTGSYRIKSDGTQSVRRASYARSEIHLNEIIERICDDVNSYTDIRPDDTPDVEYIIPDTIDGLTLKFQGKPNTRPGSLADVMKRACSELLEDHEEELITYMNKNVENVLSKYCIELTGHCSDPDFFAKRSAFINATIQYTKDNPDPEPKPEGDGEDASDSDSSDSESNGDDSSDPDATEDADKEDASKDEKKLETEGEATPEAELNLTPELTETEPKPELEETEPEPQLNEKKEPSKDEL